jgi:Flp pilus assembly protein TadD
MKHYEQALALQANDPDALGNLAWILCTCTDPSLRDGTRALELARQSMRHAPANRPDLLHILAAALAENGRFLEADETAERALTLALAQGDQSLAGFIRLARSQYQAGKPVRGTQPAPEILSPAVPR